MDIIKKIIKGKEYWLADLKARKNIKAIQESLNNSLQLNKTIKQEQDEDKKYVIDYDASKTKLNLTSTTSTVLDNCDHFCKYGKDINIVYNKTDLRCYIYTDKLINAEFYYSETFQGEQITQEDINDATKFEITPDVISTIWFDGLHTFLNYNGKNLISEGYIKNSETGVYEFLLVPMQQTTPVLQKKYIYKIRDTIYYKNNIWDPITQSLVNFQGVPNSTDYWTDGDNIYTSVDNSLYVYEGNSWRDTEKILNFEIKNTDVWYCDGSTYISKENKTYLFDSFETVTFLNGDNFSSVDKIMYLDKTPFIKNSNGEIYSVKTISEVNLTPFKHEHKDYVSVNAQTLTEAQKQQVRTNIGASKDYGVFDGTNIGLVPANDNNNKKILLGDGTWGDSTTIVNSVVHEETGAAAGTITINNIKTTIGAAIKSNTNNITTLEESVVKTVNGQTPTSGDVVINATQIKLSNDESSKTIAEAISESNALTNDDLGTKVAPLVNGVVPSDNLPGNILTNNNIGVNVAPLVNGVVPTEYIPETQVQTDWEATEGIGAILNKPTLGTAAAKNYTSSISNNSTDLPTAEAVYNYIVGLGIENIITQIGSINTNIDNIEQQLSNIFTAENKVTDFNTTTNSGIYYWIDDAANKPGTNYGVLLVNKIYSGSCINQIAYGTNDRIYFRQKINDNSWREWKTIAYYDETVAAQGYLCKLYQLSSATSDTTSQAYNVILLGKIPDPASTAAPATPATSWDIDVDFYFVRSQGHKAAWCNVKAGYGYSNAWRKYGLIETFGVDNNSNYAKPFYLITLKYNNEYYIGVRHTVDIDGSYTARVGNVYINGNRNPSTIDNTPLVNMLKIIPYQKTTNGTILNNEVKTSIADFPNTYAPTVERNGCLVLKSYADVELNTYGNEPLSIGNSDSTNIGIDGNEIQARDNGKASQLFLNSNGGAVKMGANTNFIICNGNKLTIQGDAVSSNSFTDTNPKIVFNNVNASQGISLTFTDYDAVQAPASLTLNGNQGNEYFIAPCIKANNKMKIPTSAPSSAETGCIWIE